MNEFWIFAAGFVTGLLLHWVQKVLKKINASDPIIASQQHKAAAPPRRSERDLWQAVAALDLAQPIAKLRVTYPDWDDARVVEAVNMYRQFLFLVGVTDTGPIVPWHHDLDEVWHMHILHTRAYASDCELLFGKMVHHDPTVARGTTLHDAGVDRTAKLRTWYFTPPPKASERAREDYSSSDTMMPWFLWWSISGSDPIYANTSDTDTSSDGRSDGGEQTTTTTDTGSSSCSSCSSSCGGD